MNTTEAPQATYTLTVQVQLEGVTAPLAINADSVNEIKKAMRLLREKGMLVTQPAHGGSHERISTCQSCAAPIVWRDKNGKRHPYNVVDGAPTEQSHFSSCPDAAQWRKQAA